LTTNIVGVIDGLFFRAWIPSIIAGNYCYTKEKALEVLYPPSETDASTNTWHDLLPFTSPCSNGLTITFDDGNPLAAPAAFPAWCDEPVLAICIARDLSDPSPYTNLPDVTVYQYTIYIYPYDYTRYNIYTGGVSKTKGMVLNKAGLSYYVGKVDWEFEYCTNKFW